jgi:hypothetical protein
MNPKLHPIFIITLILALVTLACGAGAKATQLPPPPTNTPLPPTPAVTLGDEQRSEEGGFAFQPVPGYTVEASFGMVNMLAPGADPDLGPSIFLVGGTATEGTTAQTLIDQLKSPELTIGEPKPITVGGVSGLAAEITRPAGNLSGRVVTVMVTPTWQFVALGGAPKDQWDSEIATLFDAVLASVSFFEPTAAALPTEPPPPPPSQGNEIRQWAISAAASSQFGESGWTASQATGAPDTTDCGDYTTAWASAGSDTVEWIKLSYATPVYATEVVIYQTYNPSSIVKIELIDLTSGYHEVYSAQPEARQCPQTLYISFQQTDYEVGGLRITIDQSVIGNWAEIDAVELVGVAVSGGTPAAAGGGSGIEPVSGLPILPGAADITSRTDLLNYWVSMDRLAVRDFYLTELPKIGWLLDLDENDKCRDNDRCMGWHNDYSDPNNPNWFFIQGDHAYLTMNLIEEGGRVNVIIGIDPNYK